MSKEVSLREISFRSAKEKATVQISNYFLPRKLQTIPESSALELKPKPTKKKSSNSSQKDKNNNNTDPATIISKNNHNKENALNPKLAKVGYIKTKRNRDDTDNEHSAKRKMIATDMVSSTPKITRIAQHQSSVSSSQSLSLLRSSSTKATVSSDVIVILDSTIESNCSMNVDSFASASSTNTDTTITVSKKNHNNKNGLNSKFAKAENIISKQDCDDTDDVYTKTAQTAQHQSSVSSSPSPSPLSSSSTKTTVSSDVIVILDNSIESNCSMNVDSFASTSSTNTSHQRSNRAANFNFDALNTDDETDTEDNTPYAPQWSKFTNRNPIVVDQEGVSTKVIDIFFGCHAESVDGKALFPNTTPIARRRSTAVWNTPPRYSMLPKY